jgi:hypothetical protein
MADALCDLIAKGTARASDNDALNIAKVITDIRFRLTFSGEPVFLTLEDKHLFTRDDLEQAARSAGFERLAIRPTYVDKNGLAGVRAYASEMSVSAEFCQLFLSTYARYAQRYFSEINPEDMSGMYVCAFHRDRLS